MDKSAEGGLRLRGQPLGRLRIESSWVSRYGEWLALAALVALAAALRLYRIDALPYGLFYDEAANVVDAQRVLQGERPLFFEGNNGREPFYFYLVALSFHLLGPGATSLRLVSVCLGLLTVPATYLLMRELFGRRVALLTTFIAATLFWPLSLSRLGFRVVSLPLFETLAVYFLWRGARRGELWAYGLAGLATGLSLYTYIASRVVPLWLGAFALALLLPAWRSQVPWRRQAAGLVVLALVAGAVFAPLGNYYVSHPSQFLRRMESVSVTAQEAEEAAAKSRQSLAESTLRTVTEFVWQGDSLPRHNLPDRPVFDPFLALAFLLGIALSLRRLRQPQYALLLLWTAVMLTPGALSAEAPHFLRTAGVLPAALAFPAIGLDAAWRWSSTLRAAVWRSLVPIGLALGLVFSAGLASRDYFVLWANRADVYFAFYGDAIDAGLLSRSLAEKGTVMVGSAFYRQVPVPLELYSDPQRRPRAFSGPGLVILPAGVEGDLYYLYPKTTETSTSALCSLLPCSDQTTIKDVAGGTAVTVVRISAAQAAELKPQRSLAARLGDGLELTGYDLTHQLEPGQPVLLTVYGRFIEPALDFGDWHLYARLVEPGVHGASEALSSADSPLKVGQLQPGDGFALRLSLATAQTLSPGDYEVQVGLAGREGDELSLGLTRVNEPLPRRPLAARIGDVVEVTGYELSRQLEPGAPARLNVYARLLQPLPGNANWQFFAHLVSPSGGGNRSSAYTPASFERSQPGDPVVIQLDLPTTRSLPLGVYQVHFGMLNRDDQHPQRIVDSAGNDVGVLILGPLRALGLAPSAPEVPHRVDAQLGDRIRLLGYQMDREPPAGGEMKLTLFWQASRLVNDDYTVFVHLVDETGKPAGDPPAQQDSQPQGGQLPTSLWSAGEVVADDHQVPIGAALRGRRLKVLVGMYKLETGQRLPATDSEGKPMGDALPLLEVTVR